jgi:hypothetical protein
MSDRHEKWVRVGPGHVIPAGQSFRKEADEEHLLTAVEGRNSQGITVPKGSVWSYFMDSSWRPPLNLPTEPTWGIAVERAGAASAVARVGHWNVESAHDGEPRFRDSQPLQGRLTFADRILDFIPLTDEQVARIEAAR